MNARVVCLLVVVAVIAGEASAMRLCQVPGEIYYHNRGPPCVPTCKDRVPENCFGGVFQAPGCYCKPNLVRDEERGICLPVHLCPV